MLKFLTIGSIGMTIITILRRKRYDITVLQSIFSMLTLTACGVLSVYILYFIENGFFGGQSFYGAVLFVPILIYPFKFVLKIPYNKFISICAPSECLMLSVMKVDCYLAGCCYGSEFFNSISPIPIQLLECVLGIIVMFGLIWLEKEESNRTILYAWYMFIYGCVRFVINTFRGNISIAFILPYGHLWSLISIIIGLGLLYKMKWNKKKIN